MGLELGMGARVRLGVACGCAFFGGNAVACTGCALRPSLAVPGGVAKSATKVDGAPGRSSGTCKASVAHAWRTHGTCTAHARHTHGTRMANATHGSMCTGRLQAPSR